MRPFSFDNRYWASTPRVVPAIAAAAMAAVTMAALVVLPAKLDSFPDADPSVAIQAAAKMPGDANDGDARVDTPISRAYLDDDRSLAPRRQGHLVRSYRHRGDARFTRHAQHNATLACDDEGASKC